jgi:cytidine deaminase
MAVGPRGRAQRRSGGTVSGMNQDVHGSGMTTWEVLLGAAKLACGSSYSPYSKYPVGAAARLSDGRVVSGANVENASYGLTLCAECAVVSQVGMTGGQITHVVCVNGEGERIPPCGRCRQLLSEFSAAETEVLLERGPVTMRELLPDAFGPMDLERVRGEQ